MRKIFRRRRRKGRRGSRIRWRSLRGIRELRSQSIGMEEAAGKPAAFLFWGGGRNKVALLPSSAEKSKADRGVRRSGAEILRTAPNRPISAQVCSEWARKS